MFQLPEEDRKLLLGIARKAVEAHLSGSAFQHPDIGYGPVLEPHGVFVSIHNGQELRGCIGNATTNDPLYRATARCAVAAATTDPRFVPVTLGELPRVSFEVSVLSIPQPVNNVEEIEVGKHGLIVSKGSARGLLLPQVATQQRWNRDRFLSETCIKAGISPQAWREGASIHSFTADVFSEKQTHQSMS